MIGKILEVLILNSSYEPLQILTLKKAMKLIFKDKVEVVEYIENKYYSTVDKSFNVPSVIRLRQQVKISRKIVPYSRKNILIRDKYTCQYCGAKNLKLSIDHIIPVSKGGKDIWTNVVTSCLKCNVIKSDKFLHQTDFQLLSIPKEPTFLHNFQNRNFHREDWHEYIFY